jgi:hypothetical protein
MNTIKKWKFNDMDYYCIVATKKDVPRELKTVYILRYGDQNGEIYRKELTSEWELISEVKDCIRNSHQRNGVIPRQLSKLGFKEYKV